MRGGLDADHCVAPPLPRGPTPCRNHLPVFTAALTPAARPLREVFASHSEPPVHAGWFVGPEGDFSEAELAELTATGATPVSLGPLVLRSETACLYGLCALNAAWL